MLTRRQFLRSSVACAAVAAAAVPAATALAEPLGETYWGISTQGRSLYVVQRQRIKTVYPEFINRELILHDRPRGPA